MRDRKRGENSAMSKLVSSLFDLDLPRFLIFMYFSIPLDLGHHKKIVAFSLMYLLVKENNRQNREVLHITLLQ